MQFLINSLLFGGILLPVVALAVSDDEMPDAFNGNGRGYHQVSGDAESADGDISHARQREALQRRQRTASEAGLGDANDDPLKRQRLEEENSDTPKNSPSANIQIQIANERKSLTHDLVLEVLKTLFDNALAIAPDLDDGDVAKLRSTSSAGRMIATELEKHKKKAFLEEYVEEYWFDFNVHPQLIFTLQDVVLGKMLNNPSCLPFVKSICLLLKSVPGDVVLEACGDLFPHLFSESVVALESDETEDLKKRVGVLNSLSILWRDLAPISQLCFDQVRTSAERRLDAGWLIPGSGSDAPWRRRMGQTFKPWFDALLHGSSEHIYGFGQDGLTLLFWGVSPDKFPEVFKVLERMSSAQIRAKVQIIKEYVDVGLQQSRRPGYVFIGLPQGLQPRYDFVDPHPSRRPHSDKFVLDFSFEASQLFIPMLQLEPDTIRSKWDVMREYLPLFSYDLRYTIAEAYILLEPNQIRQRAQTLLRHLDFLRGYCDPCLLLPSVVHLDSEELNQKMEQIHRNLSALVRHQGSEEHANSLVFRRVLEIDSLAFQSLMDVFNHIKEEMGCHPVYVPYILNYCFEWHICLNELPLLFQLWKKGDMDWMSARRHFSLLRKITAELCAPDLRPDFLEENPLEPVDMLRALLNHETEDLKHIKKRLYEEDPEQFEREAKALVQLARPPSMTVPVYPIPTPVDPIAASSGPPALPSADWGLELDVAPDVDAEGTTHIVDDSEYAANDTTNNPFALIDFLRFRQDLLSQRPSETEAQAEGPESVVYLRSLAPRPRATPSDLAKLALARAQPH